MPIKNVIKSSNDNFLQDYLNKQIQIDCKKNLIDIYLKDFEIEVKRSLRIRHNQLMINSYIIKTNVQYTLVTVYYPGTRHQ